MSTESPVRNLGLDLVRVTESAALSAARWLGMKPTTPIISGGMNALRVGGFFENMGYLE